MSIKSDVTHKKGGFSEVALLSAPRSKANKNK
jgi:hypothetical protein